MQINQVMTSYSQPNFDQIYDEKRYLSQLASEMFDFFFQQDSSKCASQLKLNNFVTMATYCVPDHPNMNGISGHLWRPIFIFANGASNT